MKTVLEYAKAASAFAIFPGHDGSPEKVELAFTYLRLGIIGEYGEICEKLKKLIRGEGYEESLGRALKKSRKDLLKEIGDVFWYVCVSALYRDKFYGTDTMTRVLDCPFDSFGPHWFAMSTNTRKDLGHSVMVMRYFSRFHYMLTAYADVIEHDLPALALTDHENDAGYLRDVLGFISGAVYVVSPLTSLKNVAVANLAKLSYRKMRGVIHGDGDNR